MTSNDPLDIFDEHAVIAALNQFCAAEEWDKVTALSKASELAKQRKVFLDAEASLSPGKRFHPMSSCATEAQIATLSPVSIRFGI